MRWISWVIALLAWAVGVGLWRVENRSAFIRHVDRTFQDRLIDWSRLPRHAPIPVTLVEMEDAENWTALEYSLFLKALPKKNPPVVIFESLPTPGDTAFDHAFQDLAIKEPRLILPVSLSLEKMDKNDTNWWLKGWSAGPPRTSLPLYASVEDGPPEALRGTVFVGVANLPPDGRRAPLCFLMGKNYVPSLALRAVMLAWKISDDKIRWDSGLMLGDQRLRLDADGSLPVDAAFLHGMRRVASSDLLLNLAGNDASGASQAAIGSEQLQGILVLGHLSEKVRTLPAGNGLSLTPAEWIAATVATICNGPPLTPVGPLVRILILTGCTLGPLFFSRQNGRGQGLAFLGLLGVYLLISISLAGRHSLATPIFLPFLVLFSGTASHVLAAIYRGEKNERN